MSVLRQLLWLAFLPWGAAHALYNGNPSFPMMPENGFFMGKDTWFTLKAGYEWDDLFDRNVELKGQHGDVLRKVRKYESMGNFGVITLGVADRVEIYTALGAVSAHVHQQPLSDTQVKYTTSSQFAWELGGRVILAYWGDLQLGIDAKYFHYSPEIDRIDVNGASVHYSEAGIHYGEWQIGAGVSYRVHIFFPYIGFKYSNLRAKFYHLNAINNIFPRKHFILENKYPFGLFFGCGLAPDKGFNINVEVRVIDETAVTVSGDIRF